MFAGTDMLADGRVSLIVLGVAPAVMSASSGVGLAVTVAPSVVSSDGCSEGLNAGFSNIAGAGETFPVLLSCGVTAVGCNVSFTTPEDIGVSL